MIIADDWSLPSTLMGVAKRSRDSCLWGFVQQVGVISFAASDDGQSGRFFNCRGV